MIRSHAQLAEALTNGRVVDGSFRRVPAYASTAGTWIDLSGASGSPPANYFATAPLSAAQLNGMRGGLFRGDDVEADGFQKHIVDLAIATPTAALLGEYLLADVVLYYPFIDGTDTATQVLDNTAVLNRYESGVGLLPVLIAMSPTIGGGSFSFRYVNQDGVEKDAPTQSCNTVANNQGGVMTYQPAGLSTSNLFCNLDAGDRGVRRVVSFTYATEPGGIACLALVKPLAQFAIYEANVPVEVSFVHHLPKAPRVHDGAFLNLFMRCAGTVQNGLLAGRLRCVWS